MYSHLPLRYDHPSDAVMHSTRARRKEQNVSAEQTDRFAFGLWTIMNVGRDPFGEPTRPAIDPLDVIEQLGKRGIASFELHAEDLIPERASAAERDRLIAEARKRMADYNIACSNCGANVFYAAAFKDGALTSTDPNVRHYALQRYMNAIDVGQALDGDLCNLWWGRDGCEVEAARDPVEAIKRLRDAMNYLQAYIDSQGYNHRLSIEAKPNEPRGDTYLPTCGHALGFIATLDKPHNCGCVPELAHIRMAGLNCVHEIAQILECGKLWGCHLNGQKPLRYDQDLRFGAEDLKECFFVVKLLEDRQWDGPRSFDAHAYRTADRDEVWDFVDGCVRTYRILRDKVVRFNNDHESQDILAHLRALEGVATPPPDELKAKAFDLDALAARKLYHERLDQIVQEILLGVR
jgi:xylose isomerase